MFIASRIGLYRAVIRFIDTKALSTIFVACLFSGVIFVVSSYFLNAKMPRSIPFIYISLLLIFVGGSRLVIRGLINTQNGKGKLPVIIYGAGSSGRQLALSLQHGAEFSPVAFIDDNKELQKITVAGLSVFTSRAIKILVEKYDVKKILLAMPSMSSKHRKRLLNQLESYSIEVLTIPGSADLVSGKLQIDTLRKVDIVDLLGRDSVKPIDRLFRRCIENKNVLVTGAGGSIGSEICRQIIKNNPSSLVLFEASEYALYSIEKELNESLLADNSSIKVLPVLANALDKALIQNVMTNFNVNTVYHAAAYKHVPIVEHNVVSGIRNNVWGTLTSAQAAKECGVENFVLISTDKAVRPTNVMGASKRIAELCLQALADQDSETNFSMVRFGNVLGSSGSVVPLFKKQITEGGPVTITHPDINRYFMTIPEAAQLVIQAGAMGLGGEVYVLDMGKPVKINSLAEKMIHLSGLTVKSKDNYDGDIEIVYTGLRPGEKLYEELLIGENVEGTKHKRIMKARESSMTWDHLQDFLAKLKAAMDGGDIALVRQLLIEAPLGFNPSSEISDSLWLKEKKTLEANMPLTLVSDSDKEQSLG
ncbi:nucleoside-diphosphate sugar epimerase/dehydratase [Litorilituus lipolyticus]|uniref:polysaccharide biosynthesis protein n=1 Tax=Litorilituus lipolyticus TaxID=2491017 RepID=UPI00319E7B88